MTKQQTGRNFKMNLEKNARSGKGKDHMKLVFQFVYGCIKLKKRNIISEPVIAVSSVF